MSGSPVGIIRFDEGDGSERLEPLYHVTFASRIPGIQRYGLRADSPANIGAGYASHRKGRVFLTVCKGVFFWFGKAEDFAEHYSDNLRKDMAIPVVLKAAVLHRHQSGRLKEDEIGSFDAYADAFFTQKPIPPSRISVFDGHHWVPVARFQPLLALQALYKDREGLYYFRNSRPLLPPECRPR